VHVVVVGPSPHSLLSSSLSIDHYKQAASSSRSISHMSSLCWDGAVPEEESRSGAFRASSDQTTTAPSPESECVHVEADGQVKGGEEGGASENAASAASDEMTGACAVDDEVGARLDTLCFLEDKQATASTAESTAEIEVAMSEHDGHAAVVCMDAQRALHAAVSDDGQDRTEWLPDELMLMVLERVPFAALWSGACERVCQRWARLMESASIVRRKREGRWAVYEAGTIKPRRLGGHMGTVLALAIGLDGNVYSGSADTTVMVWSGESGAHLQTLTGHTDRVFALAVGLDGNIYSGSYDHTVRVWSAASGAHVRTLEGHTNWVMALAVGLDGRIYSGSFDTTIRVWAANDGAHLQTLVGHTDWVRALAVGKGGSIYSGSDDTTVRVWSGEDGTHLRTLMGHTADDGRVYSGSNDNEIRVWSPDDGAHLQTLPGHTSAVWALVVSSDGKMFSGSLDRTVRVWRGVNGALLHTLMCDSSNRALALARDGTLYSGGGGSEVGVIEMW
jgi:WD40 repeat protein